MKVLFKFARHRGDQHRWTFVPLFMLAATLAHAAQGRLTVAVQSPTHEPLANVRIGIAGEGSIEPTDVGGRAVLQLGPQTSVGSHVRLQVVPPPHMFMVSPFEGDAIVPRFENDSGNVLSVILIAPGDRIALANGVVLSGMIRQSQRQANATVKTGALSNASNSYGTPVGYEPDRKAPAAAAPGRTPPVASAERLPLITNDVARRLGFDPADVESVLKGWEIDPLGWKLVMTTALFEFGDTDPFSFVSVDPYFGITVGLQRWTSTETLRPLWRRFREIDRPRFDAIMGHDAQAVAAWLAGTAEMPESMSRLIDAYAPAPARRLTPYEQQLPSAPIRTNPKALSRPMPTPPPMPSRGRVAEPWQSRIEQLGGWVPYQRIQIDAVRPLLATTDQLARSLGLRSERARAYLYDLVISGGQVGTDAVLANFFPDAKAFESQVHRSPDEQELLMMVSNRWLQRIDRGGLARFSDKLRQRRYAFALGQGRWGTQLVFLDDVGIRMRDVENGAVIPLSGDREMLDKLRAGWLPERVAATSPL